MKSWIIAGLTAAAAAGTALAAPNFEVTFTNGAVRSLPAFRVEGGYLHLTEGRIDLPKVASVRVQAALPAGPVETFWTADQGIPEELKAAQASLLSAAGLKGNAGGFLQGLLSAYFWLGEYASAEQLIAAARTSGVLLPSAPVYEALIRIGQGRTEEAQQQLAALEQAGPRSAALYYLLATAAAAQGQDKEALQHLAQIALSGGRDAEWTPAAILLEGGIYKRNGQDKAAAYAAAELTERYPGGYWSRRAEELK
jgi:tetratricopeptide (TPR) repeat protein